jgi:YNFM family putative membrane transporter
VAAADRASLLTLGTAAFLVSADARVIDPLLKIVAGEFDVSIERAALTVSAYALPYGLCQLFYGPLGDRVGKLRVMATAMVLFALGTAACAVVPNLGVFIALRLLTGSAAAAVIPLSLSYIGDKFPYESRQSALGRFMSALMLGQILSASLGGVFGEHLNWRGIFLLFGGAGLVVAGLLAREAGRFPEAHKARHFSVDAILGLWRLPAARLVLTSVFFEGFLVFGGLAFAGASMLDRFPFLGATQVGVILAGYGVGGLFYSVTVKRLVPTVGERGILMLGGSFLCAAYLLIGLMPAWWLFIPGMVVFGMGYFTMHGTLQTRATELNPQARATAVSIFAFTFFLGQAFGPAVMGPAIRTVGYAVSYGLGGVALLLLAAWTQYRLARLPGSTAPSPA